MTDKDEKSVNGTQISIGNNFKEFRLLRKNSCGTNQKVVFHLHPNRNFRNFLVNGKRSWFRSVKAETHDAISRLVCIAAATRLLALFCRCDMLHEFKPVLIRATDRSDNILSQRQSFTCHTRRFQCCNNLSRQRVAAICRIVCLGFKR